MPRKFHTDAATSPPRDIIVHLIPIALPMIDLTPLKRLGELTAQGRAPRGAARELKADSKKNRRALAEACFHGKLEDLEALIELGVGVEFFEESFPIDLASTPLRICAERKFDAGLEALLAAGAVDGATEHGGAPAWDKSALSLASNRTLPSVFQALWPDASQDFKTKAIACIHSLGLWEAMEASSADKACSADDIARIVSKSISSSPRDNSRRDFESALAAFSLAPAIKPRAELAASLWQSALLQGLPWMLEELARADIELPDTLAIEPRTLAIDHAPASYTRTARLEYGSRPEYQEWINTARRIDVPSLALPFIARNNHAARQLWCPLASIPDAYETIFKDQWARGLIVERHWLPFFKHIKNLGRDLSGWTDSKGNTPLHKAVSKYGFSKSQLLDWVQLAPDWFCAKNEQGKLPLDLLKPGDPRVAEWTSIVEKRLLKPSAKGAGRKTPSAPKRRL